MSLKKTIYDTLKPFGLPLAYADTDLNVLPRLNFFLVSHFSIRSSNQSHQQKLTYQVEYYSDRPLDVENNDTLWNIIDALESNNLITTDWVETSAIDVEEDIGVYRYWIEVKR